jgi:hypothetical protein
MNSGESRRGVLFGATTLASVMAATATGRAAAAQAAGPVTTNEPTLRNPVTEYPRPPFARQ